MVWFWVLGGFGLFQVFFWGGEGGRGSFNIDLLGVVFTVWEVLRFKF